MIYVDRRRLDPKGQPIQPSESWFSRAAAETQKARTTGDTYEIVDLYREESVRRALEELFHRKCAYCETPLAEVGWEVEHFRPKKGVTESANHPGYYWLAYTWSNLYPSCETCNKRLEDRPTWGEPTHGPKAGKANRFPLADETWRAFSWADDIEREKPLLLDPCADRPEAELRYTPLGNIEPAVPGESRATATIEVFHLTRRRLADRRKEHLDTVIVLLQTLNRLRALSASDAAEFEADLERKFFADTAPFAGAARQILRDPDAFGV